MTYPVKWFLSSMAGSPRCSGTPGDLIALLDACLINGFNVNAVASLVVTGGVATATFGVDHGYKQHQIVLIAGATPAGLNGEKRVLSADTYTITFDATGIADGTATGTIECRTAPVGSWEKTYEATQKGAYRSTDGNATGLFLRVDDTVDTYAVAKGYESMTDVDTGLGQFGTFYWHKSNAAGTTARPWALFADSAFIYLFTGWSGGVKEGNTFGDIISFKPADSYHAIIGGTYSTSRFYVGSQSALSTCAGNESGTGYSTMPIICRPYSQSGAPLIVKNMASRVTVYFGYQGWAYPSPINSGMTLHYPVMLREGDQFRGHYPGLMQPIQNVTASDNIVTLDNGDLVLLVLSGLEYAGQQACCHAINITSWR